MKTRPEKFFAGLVTSLVAGFWSGRKAYQATQNYRGRPRESSFPFISSDTFRAAADIVISAQDLPEKFERIAQPKKPSIVMVEIPFVTEMGGKEALKNWLENSRTFSEATHSVVLHHGDLVPEDNYLQSLASTGAKIFCVNVLDNLDGVTPVPVGLENLTRRKNGVLDDFLLAHDQLRDPNGLLPPKKSIVFSSFKIATNRRARQPLAELLANSRFGYVQKRLSMSEHKLRTLETHFVLSPPGNGLDCYRTWESIYLGAIPVVLEGSLAPSLTNNLPIKVVKSWEEFFETSDEELVEEYWSLMKRDRTMAYFSYWLDKLKPEVAHHR